MVWQLVENLCFISPATAQTVTRNDEGLTLGGGLRSGSTARPRRPQACDTKSIGVRVGLPGSLLTAPDLCRVRSPQGTCSESCCALGAVPRHGMEPQSLPSSRSPSGRASQSTWPSGPAHRGCGDAEVADLGDGRREAPEGPRAHGFLLAGDGRCRTGLCDEDSAVAAELASRLLP